MVSEHKGAHEHKSRNKTTTITIGKTEFKGKEFKLKHSGKKLKRLQKKYNKSVADLSKDKEQFVKTNNEVNRLKSELSQMKNTDSRSYKSKVQRKERLTNKGIEIGIKSIKDIKKYNETKKEYFTALGDNYKVLARRVGYKILRDEKEFDKLAHDSSKKKEAYDLRVKIAREQQVMVFLMKKEEQSYKIANQ